MGQYTDKDCFSSGATTTLADGWCLNTATGATTSTQSSSCTSPNLFTPTSSHVMGPLPYVYVPYSTKTPTQPSSLTDNTGTAGAAGTIGAGDTNYDVVCPLCTHPKYCMQGKPDLKAYADDGGIIRAGTVCSAGSDRTGEWHQAQQGKLP